MSKGLTYFSMILRLVYKIFVFQEPRNCCITDSPMPETRSSVAKDTNQLQDFWLMSMKSRMNLKDLSSKLERKMSRLVPDKN